MSRRRFCFVLLASTLVMTPSLSAQVTRSGLVSQTALNRFGLHRCWFTQVELNRARGRVAYLTQHVSSTDAYTVFEVAYDGGEIVYTERDLDRFGDPLGKAGAQKLAEHRIDDLKRAGRNPKMTTKVIPEILLYVMTDRGVIQAIDAETGRTRWATPVGSRRRPSEAPGASDQYVAVVNGSTLYVLNKNDGRVAWQRQVKGVPGAGPAVTDRYVFVPMVNGAIESYQLKDHRQPPWIFRSHGRAVIQPVYTGFNIAWPTDRGDLYVAEGNQNNIRYRLETNDAIVAPASLLPPTGDLPSRLLTASIDGYVYCLHENSGAIQWRFSTGEPVSSSPVVVGDAIYVVTDDHSMFKISADVGEEQWWIPGMTSFVAAGQARLYCINRAGRLAILDSSSGSLIGSLPTETLDLTYVNQQTDRIIIGTRTGIIQCVREIQQKWPLIHVDLAEKEVEKKPRKKKSKPKDETPEEKPKALDPFGAPAAKDSDPFGTGGGDPFGTGSEGGTGSGGGGGGDPFGSSSSGSDPFG
ncbi:MAG: PQQ-binding-like beta-propeller repeat protein [Pirellulaceae bacterium]